jgi:hypothetical protein
MGCNDGYNKARFSVNLSSGTFIGDLIGVVMRITGTCFLHVFIVWVLSLMVVGAQAQTTPDAHSITVYQEAG